VPAKPTEKPRRSPLPPPARRYVPVAPSASRFAAPLAARYVAAKAVGTFVPALARKSFEKFGFATAALFTDWDKIVGTDIAGYAVPDRLKWPRGGQAEASDEAETERRGATLTLRVDPARALDVEYRTRQIGDRINAYFGYRAVETIRLVQAPLDVKPAASPAASRRPATPSTLPDDPLLAALARMEQGVLRGRSPRRG